MSEQIIPVSTDLWLIIEQAALDSDGLFKIIDGVGGEVLVDRDEVPALIDVLHKFQDEYGGPKEQLNG